MGVHWVTLSWQVWGVLFTMRKVTILSYSGPAGFCSIKKDELMALNIGLHEATRLNPQKSFVEGDSTYFI